MKFLIFGGTGFVGRNLGMYLKEKDHEVISASRTGGPGTVNVDITNPETFSRINSIPEVVVNCASVVPARGRKINDPEFLNELFVTNTIGGANIANWAVQRGVEKIINCSTLVVVKKPWPNPLTEEDFELPVGPHVGYAMSKLSQEQVMTECTRNSGTDVVHLRLSSIYGRDMVSEGIIFDILRAANDGIDIVLKDAEKNFVDLLHVDDVCKGIEKIANKDLFSGATTVNLASGTEISILQLAGIIKKLSHSCSNVLNQKQETRTNRANIRIDKFFKVINQADFPFRPLEKGLEELVSYQQIKKDS